MSAARSRGPAPVVAVWAVPVIALVPFPLAAFPLVFAVVVMTVLMALGESTAIDRIRATTSYGLVVRGAWLGIAVLGLIALIQDVVEIRQVV